MRLPNAPRCRHTTTPTFLLSGARFPLYEWVLEADIEACFDNIDHTALMGRVRRRVGVKRVLALVKAFLKAGILIELGSEEDTVTGTPQGGILSAPTQVATSSSRC
jgi:retron-type reverse transcriptase